MTGSGYKRIADYGTGANRRQGGGECPDPGPCEASVLASVFCELSTARSEHGAARRPRIGQLRQDPSPASGEWQRLNFYTDSVRNLMRLC